MLAEDILIFMRLSPYQHQAIREVIINHDPKAEIYLFGSRVDDDSRGGDIDLLILSKVISENDRRSIKVDLLERLGEQKLDLIIASDLSKPFVRIAYNQGCRL